MCVNVHQSVAVMSKRFLAELSRHIYVTPTIATLNYWAPSPDC